MINKVDYEHLRTQLNDFGYEQPLPLNAIPLVRTLFEDLIKTTESLRNAKFEIGKLLEEKQCWELGVEPYRCDNSKLVSECNNLNLKLIHERELNEEKIIDLNKKIAKLEVEKQRLGNNTNLEKTIQNSGFSINKRNLVKNKKENANTDKKPFVSAVRRGEILSKPLESEIFKCTKCNCIKNTKNDYENIENSHFDGVLSEKISFLLKKVDTRDREIRRLNELLIGGRPPAALAKDCCYKNISSLSEDVEILQREKVELVKKLKNAHDSMHEAMQKAIFLNETNKKLEQEFKELEKTALNLENQANIDISEKEKIIQNLKEAMKNLEYKMTVHKEKKLNQTEKVRRTEHHNRVTSEMENKLVLPKNTKNVECLQQEVNTLRNENLKLKKTIKDGKLEIPKENLAGFCCCASVKNTVMLLKNERDKFENQLKQVRLDRDKNYEKYVELKLTQTGVQKQFEAEIKELHAQMYILGKENNELKIKKNNYKTKYNSMVDEIKELKNLNANLQSTNSALNSSNMKLKTLQQSAEQALLNYQNRLTEAEERFKKANYTIHAISNDKDQCLENNYTIQAENQRLRSRNKELETENEYANNHLDKELENKYELENLIKKLKQEQQDKEKQIGSLNGKINCLSAEQQLLKSQLSEYQTRNEHIEHQYLILQKENEELKLNYSYFNGETAENKEKLLLAEKKLMDSQKEVTDLKLQLQQYVKKVQKAENVLLEKENERDEMLKHFHDLSQGIVELEDSRHQTLEKEALKQRHHSAKDEITLKKKNFKNQIEKFLYKIIEMEVKLSKLNKDVIKNQISDFKKLCKCLQNDKFDVCLHLKILVDLRKCVERINELLIHEWQYTGCCHEKLCTEICVNMMHKNQELKWKNNLISLYELIYFNIEKYLNEFKDDLLNTQQNSSKIDNLIKGCQEISKSSVEDRIQQSNSCLNESSPIDLSTKPIKENVPRNLSTSGNNSSKESIAKNGELIKDIGRFIYSGKRTKARRNKHITHATFEGLPEIKETKNTVSDLEKDKNLIIQTKTITDESKKDVQIQKNEWIKQESPEKKTIKEDNISMKETLPEDVNIKLKESLKITDEEKSREPDYGAIPKTYYNADRSSKISIRRTSKRALALNFNIDIVDDSKNENQNKKPDTADDNSEIPFQMGKDDNDPNTCKLLVEQLTKLIEEYYQVSK